MATPSISFGKSFALDLVLTESFDMLGSRRLVLSNGCSMPLHILIIAILWRAEQNLVVRFIVSSLEKDVRGGRFYRDCAISLDIATVVSHRIALLVN